MQVLARRASQLVRSVAAATTTSTAGHSGHSCRHVRGYASPSIGAPARNPGIVGWSVYVPRNYVSQKDLESYDGVADGKYTIGLGQSNMAYAGPNEDIVSMMLTATQSLLERSGVDPTEVGRLEVGTETLVDKSKATKTSLMQLFGDASDVEGVDTINACFGGTNALFNALHWMSSTAWDGRYAIVVTGDIAVYEAGPARPTGGAGVIAMLVGPDAPIVFDVSAPRATHMEDAYDFYKPQLTSEYPTVDGHLSNGCYLRALDKCFERVAAKHMQRTGQPFDFRDYQHAIFHQPYQKLVQKSFARYLWNQHRLYQNVDASLDQFLNLQPEDTYTSRDLDRATGALVKEQDLYNQRVFASTKLGRESGNMYTGSLYAALASLVTEHTDSLDAQQALLFSYGSGLAATLFQTRFNSKAAGVRSKLVASGDEPTGRALSDLSDMLQLDELLSTRVQVAPEEYTQTLERRRASYGNFPQTLEAPQVAQMRPNTFYLKEVDERGRRSYARFDSSSS